MILCHLSGLTAAGYTYVSIEIISVIYNNDIVSNLKRSNFFKLLAVKNCQQILLFHLLHNPNASVYIK